MRYLSFLIVLASLSCQSLQSQVDRRPVYHYSQPQNWSNDPNGMLYVDGEYHLFYQYNPFGTKWGHMSWGHAVTKDLQTWESLPVALTEIKNPDGSTDMFFSGGAVVDSLNTSGFFKPGYKHGIVAIYTIHKNKDHKGLGQSQGIAYSEDKGRTFKVYEGNPVLDIGLADFRDPSVMWDPTNSEWIMTVAVPLEHKVQFYSSKNLKTWELKGEFGKQGDVTKIWECPSLSQVQVENSSEKKWVLIISSGHKYDGFVGMQYFVGDFDGKTFTPQKQEGVFHIDEGKDFYAAIPFGNPPATQPDPIIIGWASNWAYAGDIPTGEYRGQFSLPRKLTLVDENGTLKLRQRPIISGAIPTEKVTLAKDGTLSSALSKKNENVYRLELDLELKDSKGFEIALLKHDSFSTLLSYDVQTSTLTFDRNNSGETGFSENFKGLESMVVKPENGKLKLDIIVDKSLVEVYANDGKAVMTELVFPKSNTSSYSIKWK